MRRSARLRSVMLRATKIMPWNCGSSVVICEPVSDTGIVWPWRVCAPRSRACPARRAAGRSSPRSRSSKIERDGSAASALPRRKPSSLQADWLATLMTPSGEVTNTASVMLPSTLVEVVLVDRGLAQPLAHALERGLQVAELVAAPDVDGARIVALADAFGALDERRRSARSSRRPTQLAATAAAASPSSAMIVVATMQVAHLPGLRGGQARADAGAVDAARRRARAARRAPRRACAACACPGSIRASRAPARPRRRSGARRRGRCDAT